MKFINKYFKPKSVTWWSGIALLGFGVFNKDAQSILAGLAAVGFRGAIE